MSQDIFEQITQKAKERSKAEDVPMQDKRIKEIFDAVDSRSIAEEHIHDLCFKIFVRNHILFINDFRYNLDDLDKFGLDTVPIVPMSKEMTYVYRINKHNIYLHDLFGEYAKDIGRHIAQIVDNYAMGGEDEHARYSSHSRQQHPYPTY